MASAQKRCYYDIIGVERNATDEEIRKSYKKLSLKLHPDKNQNSQESTKSFSELQAAFEVLIDKQERAWYDKHPRLYNYPGARKPRMLEKLCM